MVSIISHVILPGVGSVCPECLSRGHIPAFPLAPREVYSFGVSEPPAQIDWDIDAARAMIVARPRVPRRLDPAWLEVWLAERTSITAEHLAHIPGDRLDEPGIVVELVGGPVGEPPRPFRLLIDGTHRCARKLRDAQECWAYVLTEREQRSICTYRLAGGVAEMPTFPGAGVSERDAGILLAPSETRNDVA